MNLVEKENEIQELEKQRALLEVDSQEYMDLSTQIQKKQSEAYTNLSAWDRVTLARANNRPKAQDYIDALLSSFIELHGDRRFSDDGSIIGGIGFFEQQPITVIAQSKGKSVDENVKKNFGMVSPEGYRKALRLAKQAEKFHRPILTIVDTPGAYPGKGAEERGQAQAIAECLYTFADLQTPVICLVIGEGGSGGALALSVADRILMLENAVYSILSPEGFASILWKDETRYQQAASAMKMTSYDLKEKGFVDTIIKEPLGGADKLFALVVDQIQDQLRKELETLTKTKPNVLVSNRLEKIRSWGLPSWKM